MTHFKRICEASEVRISKLRDNLWEDIIFDGEEFTLLKEGETYNFQFKEILSRVKHTSIL